MHCSGVVKPGGLMDLVLEGPGVNRVLTELDCISRRGGGQDARGCPGRAAWLQRTAQMRDIRLHRGEGPRRRLIGIEILDEPVGGDNPAAFRDQPGKDAPLPRPANVGRDAVDDDFQRAEHPNPDHTHLADEEDQPHPDASAAGPQAGRKPAASAPSHTRYVTTAPPFALRTRTAQEPEPDLTAIVVIHRAIRQDLHRLAACLGEIAARGAPPKRSRALCRYTAALLAEIRAHLQNEDDILWPVIAATAGQAVDLTPLTDDHQAIQAAADRAAQALASFRAEPRVLAELYASVRDLRDMVDEHIADEEQQILPAMRRYLTAPAYRWCQKQIRRKATWPGPGFTAPWLERHAQPDELSKLLATGGWPARIITRSRYAWLERQAFGSGHL